MEKVKVSKEVFEALEEIKGWTCEGSVKLSMHHCGDFCDKRSCLNDLDAMVFAKCLILGYELEMTKEEKLLEFYNNYCDEFSFQSGVKFGVLQTLKILELEIK